MLKLAFWLVGVNQTYFLIGPYSTWALWPSWLGTIGPVFWLVGAYSNLPPDWSILVGDRDLYSDRLAFFKPASWLVHFVAVCGSLLPEHCGHPGGELRPVFSLVGCNQTCLLIGPSCCSLWQSSTWASWPSWWGPTPGRRRMRTPRRRRRTDVRYYILQA